MLSHKPPAALNVTGLYGPDPFLPAHKWRIISMFPGKNIQPAHFIGLSTLLDHTYSRLVSTLVSHGIRLGGAVHRAKRYIAALRPPDFKTFSRVATSAARVSPHQLGMSQSLYPYLLKIVQASMRAVLEDDPDWTPTEVADACVNELRKRLIDFTPEFRDWFMHPDLLNPNLFLTSS